MTGDEDDPVGARQWLEDFATANMDSPSTYGEHLPATACPAGATGIFKEIAVEFSLLLDDGTRITTTRPLNMTGPNGLEGP